MDNFKCGLIGGIVIGLVLSFGFCLGIVGSADIDLKEKYIQCGIASYNTTSGAFEFKPQYKILGE